ncbi:MAG TPA: TadE/TadG family type IV pilus assembly protein [Terriglobia bacterium]|nr:TadE/TadG family type IV pilus assembly protein [Terriglobia bacterium]
MNRSIKTPNDSRRGSTNKALLARFRSPVSVVAIRFSTAFKNADGAELLEFALALPLILVMAVGLLDFARAYNIKQKLANAAREGVRYQATETSDKDVSSPASVQTLRDDVVTYLTNAGVDTSFIGTTLSYDPSTGVFTGTYYTTQSGVSYGLKVERAVAIAAGGTSIPSTRVTLYYPYNWTFGFNSIIKLLLPSSTFSNPITIQADATMSNFQ